MIFDIPAASFGLIMLCAFSAGLLGAAVVEISFFFIRRKKTHPAVSKQFERDRSACGWQKSARDEQLYSGR